MTTHPTRADLHDELGIAIRKHGVACPTALLVEVMDAIESHDARLERAEWWREVTDPNEIIPAGCPVRTEYSGSNSEHEPKYSSVRGSYSAPHLFIDARWTPPRPASKVGDVIKTVEDLERLPVGAGVVDYRGEIAIKRWEQRWNYANLSSESCGSESIMGLAPITVIYVPEGEA